jgi:hypothetical protein
MEFVADILALGVGCPSTSAFPVTYHPIRASFPFICRPIIDRNTTDI